MTYNIVGSTPNQKGQFKFYINGEETEHQFPFFTWNDDGVTLAILKGVTVNVVDINMMIAPVYKPVFIFDKRPGSIRIEAAGARISVFKRWPPLYFERVNPRRKHADIRDSE